MTEGAGEGEEGADEGGEGDPVLGTGEEREDCTVEAVFEEADGGEEGEGEGEGEDTFFFKVENRDFIRT